MAGASQDVSPTGNSSGFFLSYSNHIKFVKISKVDSNYSEMVTLYNTNLQQLMVGFEKSVKLSHVFVPKYQELINESTKTILIRLIITASYCFLNFYCFAACCLWSILLGIFILCKVRTSFIGQ
ncbi:hypothetical protein KFK09_025456 [Dendrobium nobile]|uniref:Uncharacterized protein n=1 Tax=Dendrobium nobile TaxID=94219 RepID=A0A8T3AFG4_DENNO|nr:hypothetical protein KFK09_025456 [Dendrobium nobile]